MIPQEPEAVISSVIQRKVPKKNVLSYRLFLEYIKYYFTYKYNILFMTDHTETTPWGVDPPLFFGNHDDRCDSWCQPISAGGGGDLIAWDEIFTSVGECSAGPAEQFFLAYGGSYYFSFSFLVRNFS